MSATPRYTTQQDLPYLIEVGRDTRVTCPVWLNGSTVTPSVATVTVRTDTATLVSAVSATIDNGIAEYVVLGTATLALTPSSGWSVEWTLTVPGAPAPIVMRSTAYLVRARLYPTIADADIVRRVPSLGINVRGRPTVASSYQSLIDEADTEIQRRLIAAGRRPWLIVDAWALREVWLTLTLALIYESLQGTAGTGDPYTERAAQLRIQFEAAWTAASVQLDWDEDGRVDEHEARTTAKPTGVWLC